MTGPFKLKNHLQENKIYINRTIFAIASIVLLIVMLIGRLYFLQIHCYEIYSGMARNNQIREIPIPPNRGLIYDRNGVLLAENVPSFSLEITPARIKNVNLHELFARLKNVIHLYDNEIALFKKLTKQRGMYESIPLKNKLSSEELAKFSIDKHLYPEVEIIGRLSRYYPYDQTFAHVLGYIGPLSENDMLNINLGEYRGIYWTGKAGIEKHYEALLKGVTGYKQAETDVHGRIVRILDTVKPTPGSNIYLEIDSRLQAMAQKLLANKQGAIVMIDVKTGGILAMASAPSYNPNLFTQGIDQAEYNKLQNHPDRPLFNRAIRGQYPPGSTVKPIVALQALELNIINKDEYFFDPGFYKINNHGRAFRDWKQGGHGQVNLDIALSESCSTYFYYVADRLGIDAIHQIFKKFGLGEPVGIDIQGEASGVAPSPAWKRANYNSEWFRGETLMTGIGQSYTTATPLQIAHMTATIASKGLRLQPHIMQAVQAYGQDREFWTSKNKANIKLRNNKHWDIIIQGMEGVIKHPKGTAHYIYKPERRIAGKTGTAQVFGLKQGERYVEENVDLHLRDHGLFMAFAPIEDPQIAIVIMLEHSKGSPNLAAALIDLYQSNK
jgi:penicillin-binding protein 2